MPKRVGEVRPSQVLHTFGIGAMVDLPGMSAMVMGIDHWASPRWDPLAAESAIPEERLLALVRSHLGNQVKQLTHPPIAEGDGFGQIEPSEDFGIPVTPFPRWVRCPRCEYLGPLDAGVFDLKWDRYHPDRTHYVHSNCPKWNKPPPVIPVRFVVVCESGHIDDFPWSEFVQHKVCGCKGPLRLAERGVSSEVADLWVVCSQCDAQRQMIHAFGKKAKDELPKCGGVHPHVGKGADPCGNDVRTMLAGASNIWFALKVSALSLPPKSGEVRVLIDKNWPVLKEIKNESAIDMVRNFGMLKEFTSWSNEKLWKAIQDKQSGSEEPVVEKASDLKIDEWKLFSDPDNAIETPDFRVRNVAVPRGYEKQIARVVLVERLREVRAMTGFTRIGSPGDYGDISEIPNAKRVPLSTVPAKWVPAAEVRGEGIFIQFDESAIESWLGDTPVMNRNERLEQAHKGFRRVRNIDPIDDGFAAGRFALLHSFSHALMRQFAIESGYSAASIRERIYSLDPGEEGGPMAGILLYTAASDSEGTLGGLVELGRPDHLLRHIDQALDRCRLCSSDPLCCEHRPDSEGRALHASACHACMFVSETSCERGNKYLDRSLLVTTMGSTVRPFFGS